MIEYIDIGVNLTGGSFRDDLDEVIKRALNAGVGKLIVTGTDIEHSQSAVDLCSRNPEYLKSTAGVHPHHASEYEKDTNARISELCAEDCVVAVGECGLDYNRNYSKPEQQRAAFEQQLRLACDLNLPVFLHQRDAHDEFVRIIADFKHDLVGAVAHCFTGTVDEALEYVDMDMYIGVTGWVCDERRGQDLQRAVCDIPVDRIMLETDAPYLLPRDLGEKPVKQRRNEPCYLPHICQATARHMGLDASELARITVENSRRFFNI